MAKASAQPARVTIAIGNEPLFIERTVRVVAKAATKDDPQAQRFDIAAGESTGGLAIREACAPTLFGDTSVVIVTGIDSCSDEVDAALREVVTDFPDHVWLIVTHPGGVKGKNLLDALKKAGARTPSSSSPGSSPRISARLPEMAWTPSMRRLAMTCACSLPLPRSCRVMS